MRYVEIQHALWGTGLICRGGFHPGPDDRVPDADGPVNTVVVVGNAGEAMWIAFKHSPEFQEGDAGDNPLDAWTERVMTEAAHQLGARVVFPFGGPPYLPFQQWARKADNVHPSPIGPLIHAEFGLWHAYRGAFLFADSLSDLPRPGFVQRPCDKCRDRPCLNTCPVEAFTSDGYSVGRCVVHMEKPEGSNCLELGCRARRGCPVGVRYQYQPEQAQFHQQHFLVTNGLSEDPEPGF